MDNVSYSATREGARPEYTTTMKVEVEAPDAYTSVPEEVRRELQRMWAEHLDRAQAERIEQALTDNHHGSSQ